MMNILKNRWEIVIIFLSSLTPFLWLKDNQVILGHDSGFRTDTVAHLSNLFYSWMPQANFGFDWSIFKGFLMAQLPETFFTLLTGSLHYGQIFTFVFWFFVIGLSMYIFIYYLFPQKELWVFRLFSSTFYMYNFFLLQGWFIAERAKFSLFAALPLGLLVIYNTFTKKYSIKKGAILFAFVLFFLNGGGFPSLYGGVILVYFVAFCYLTAIHCMEYGVKDVWRSFIVGTSFIAATTFLNAYWIAPQINLIRGAYAAGLSAQGGIEGVIAWEGVVSKYASMINLFRFQGIPDWYENLTHPYASYFQTQPFVIIGSFAFITLIAIGLFYKSAFPKSLRNDRLLYLILLLFLVGTVFTSGSHPPFGSLYLFLVKNIPGFVIFRSSLYKFGPVLWFSAAFLSGYFLNLLIVKFVKKKAYYFLVGTASILFVLAYHSPFFTKDIFAWNKPFTTRVEIPKYVTQIAEYLNKDSSSGRILLMPQLHPYYKADSYLWGFWSLWPLPHTIMNKAFVVNDSNGEKQLPEDIYSSLKDPDSTLFLRLIGLVGINKILWRGDTLYDNKMTRGDDFTPIHERLQELPGIKEERKNGKWEVYSLQNPYYLPLFYISDSVIQTHTNVPVKSVLRIEDTSPRFSTVYAPVLPSGTSDTELTEASCILCSEQELWEMRNAISLPTTRFLPDSLFYFITPYKEALVRKTARESVEKTIDLNLSLANKRLAEEILLFHKGHNENTGRLHSKTVKQYRYLIDESIKSTNKLSSASQNAYRIKILAYLTAHKAFVANDKQSLPDPVFADLSHFLETNTLFLEKNTWMTVKPSHLRYLFSLDQSGRYTIKIAKTEAPLSKIILDGTEVQSPTSMLIHSGYHKLELQYPEQKNLLISKKLEDMKKVDLPYKATVTYGIGSFNPEKRYIIRFSYRKTKGVFPPTLSVVQSKKGATDTIVSKTDFGLNTHGYWDTFYYVVTPEPGVVGISLSFTNFSFDQAALDIKDFKVYTPLDPVVFIEKKIREPLHTTLPISFQRINPTKYIVSIKDAKGPFFLNFGEAYHPGWKAYVTNDSSLFSSLFAQKILEESHFMTNGYANGWYVHKPGTYTIIVEYAPQRYVYVGGFVTIFTLVLFTISLKRGEKNENKN